MVDELKGWKNCLLCTHNAKEENQKYVKDGTEKYVCDAYPNGIPIRILSGELFHNTPWLQNNRKVFEQKFLGGGYGEITMDAEKTMESKKLKKRGRPKKYSGEQ